MIFATFTYEETKEDGSLLKECHSWFTDDETQECPERCQSFPTVVDLIVFMYKKGIKNLDTLTIDVLEDVSKIHDDVEFLSRMIIRGNRDKKYSLKLHLKEIPQV